MANYNAQAPPYAISPGDVALGFDSESPGASHASQQFALPNYSGFPDSGHTIRWQMIFGPSPFAVSMVLQTAMVDDNAQYSTIDTSRATAGEARTNTGVRGNFISAKDCSITGGSGVIVGAARCGLKSRYGRRDAFASDRLPYAQRLAAHVTPADPTVPRRSCVTENFP